MGGRRTAFPNKPSRIDERSDPLDSRRIREAGVSEVGNQEDLSRPFLGEKVRHPAIVVHVLLTGTVAADQKLE
jgi:hypothetical protein